MLAYLNLVLNRESPYNMAFFIDKEENILTIMDKSQTLNFNLDELYIAFLDDFPMYRLTKPTLRKYILLVITYKAHDEELMKSVYFQPSETYKLYIHNDKHSLLLNFFRKHSKNEIHEFD